MINEIQSRKPQQGLSKVVALAKIPSATAHACDHDDVPESQCCTKIGALRSVLADCDKSLNAAESSELSTLNSTCLAKSTEQNSIKCGNVKTCLYVDSGTKQDCLRASQNSDTISTLTISGLCGKNNHNNFGESKNFQEADPTKKDE